MLPVGVGELGRSGSSSVWIREDEVMEESAGVDLPERLLRSVVGKLLEPLARVGGFDGLAVALAGRMFPVGVLVEVFEIESRTPRRLERKDHSVLHAKSSRCSVR